MVSEVCEIDPRIWPPYTVLSTALQLLDMHLEMKRGCSQRNAEFSELYSYLDVLQRAARRPLKLPVLLIFLDDAQ